MNPINPYNIRCGDLVKLECVSLWDPSHIFQVVRLQSGPTYFKATVDPQVLGKKPIVVSLHFLTLAIDSGCPAVPEALEKKPKDGDHISEHAGHEIVTASAGGEAYKYCRTCKVEVVEGGRIMRGSDAKIKIAGEDWRTFPPTASADHSRVIRATGKDLEEIAWNNFGVRKEWIAAFSREETDQELRERLVSIIAGKR